MNVANLELCKELFNLSGWDSDDIDYSWIDYMVNGEIEWVLSHFNDIERRPHKTIPAYDLGYLLRKLPNEATSKKRGGYHYLYLHHGKQDWYAYYGEIDTTELMASADTPEDAAAKLAIELFKQKILTPAVDREAA